MSRQTEKAMKAAMEYLNKHATGDESEKEMNELLMKFMNEYNSKLHDERWPRQLILGLRQ